MTWGDTFNRHKAKGMDPSDAAFRADLSDPMRKRRLEVENERLREALVQADLTIRSLPGTDQSDVQFIREALGRNPAPQSIKDARPANCRFRLQDEGKPFPKSACESCGKTIMTGLGKACSFSPSPENRAAAPAPLNSDKDGGGEC